MSTLVETLNQWMTAYTEGREFSPFPDDPDGGEMRIAAALRRVLVMLDNADQLQKPYINKYGGQATLTTDAIRAEVQKTFEYTVEQS